ncbi:MAG: lipoate--protein ligase family protein [Acidobacteria bacterium]|nr:lipoate--protein ligase family protein [Candidatus Sulfomarinibacter kjeldsenii]
MTADSTTWRLIIDGDLPGAHNMARDVAILEAVSEGQSPPTLRLYGWDPPCLTLGRHQGDEAADFLFCSAEGIDVVRRPTGGRALLHHLELTYSVMAPLGEGPLPRGLQDAYRLICGALVQAMQALGVEAELTEGDVNLQLPGPRSTVPCFEAPAGGEVVVHSRKLIGSAMRAHAGAILQHGAIVLDWDGHLQAGAMGLEDDSVLRSHVTTLADELESPPTRAVLEQTVFQAFADEFEVELQAAPTSSAERAAEATLETSFSATG